MDIIVFALILATAFIIIFVKQRWIVVTSFAVTFIVTIFLFAHHVTSVLDLSF